MASSPKNSESYDDDFTPLVDATAKPALHHVETPSMWQAKLHEIELENVAAVQKIHDLEMQNTSLKTEMEEYRKKKPFYLELETRVRKLEIENKTLNTTHVKTVAILRKELADLYTSQITNYRQEMEKADLLAVKMEQKMNIQEKEIASLNDQLKEKEEEAVELERNQKLAEIRGKLYQADSRNYKRLQTLLRFIVVRNYVKDFRIRKNMLQLHEALFRANVEAQSKGDVDTSKIISDDVDKFREPYKTFSGRKGIKTTQVADAVFRLFYLLENSIKQFQEREQGLKLNLRSQEERLSKVMSHMLEKDKECHEIRARYNKVEQKLFRICESSAHKYKPFSQNPYQSKSQPPQEGGGNILPTSPLPESSHHQQDRRNPCSTPNRLSARPRPQTARTTRAGRSRVKDQLAP